jgi:hypothetical protein
MSIVDIGRLLMIKRVMVRLWRETRVQELHEEPPKMALAAQ